MKKIYTVAKYAKSIMLAAVMTASALTTVNAQEENSNSTIILLHLRVHG